MMKFMIMILALSIDLIIVRHMTLVESVEEDINEELEFFFGNSIE